MQDAMSQSSLWIWGAHIVIYTYGILLDPSVFGSVFVSSCSRICGSSVTRYSTGFLCEAISCSSPDPWLDQ